MNHRAFTFAALLAAAAGPAFAGAPPAERAEQAPASLPLSARWTLDVKDGVLTARLALTNTSSAPVDVVVARGRGPGAYVQASVAGQSLEAILDEAQQSEMMSRMGPMPKYGAILANQEIEAGTWRFRLPAGFQAGQPLHLQAHVSGVAGSQSVFSIDLGGRPEV